MGVRINNHHDSLENAERRFLQVYVLSRVGEPQEMKVTPQVVFSCSSAHPVGRTAACYLKKGTN